VGDAVNEQLAPVLGDVQLTTMLPEPSEPAVNVELVQVSEAANVGIGATANPVEATAAASTRLMLRWFVCIGLPRKAAAKPRHCAEQALRHMGDRIYDDDILPGRPPPRGDMPRTSGRFVFVMRPKPGRKAATHGPQKKRRDFLRVPPPSSTALLRHFSGMEP
jgi:hypothetical protein